MEDHRGILTAADEESLGAVAGAAVADLTLDAEWVAVAVVVGSE